jgi:TorA maturation chaperone TorD
MNLTRREEKQHAMYGVAAVPLPPPLPQEEQARADVYALIARLLVAPPDAGLLADLANADSLASQQSDNPLDIAWEKLILTAGIMDVHAINDEFNAMFISVGSPQIDPYASVYLAGFMNEKPLAALRTELAQLGLARVPGVGEMEDHLAALCEIMRLMITGGQGAQRQSIRRQRQFFDKHIAPWYADCLEDIRSAEGVSFYRHVTDFTQAFFTIESEAFEMEEVCQEDYR